MKFKVIVTGVTGMVGEGVMHECLLSNDVEQVLALTRKPSGVTHPKLKEIVHGDFYDVSALEAQFKEYDACFFCLGVSSVGMKEDEFTHKTYDLTMHVAKVMAKANPNMTFCYISGARTDSSETGNVMWARVKGKTENDLMKLFPKAYMFRPGYMQPNKGLTRTLKAYKYMSWMYPALKLFFPKSVSTLKELGLAMINSVSKGYDKKVIEVTDILKLAKQ